MGSSFFENSGLCTYEKNWKSVIVEGRMQFENNVGCKQAHYLEMWDALNAIKNKTLLNVESLITIVAVLAN